MKNGNGNTSRDQALAAVPEQRRAALLARAADLGVQSPQDTVWILLAMTLDAKEQVDSVAGHVERLHAEIAQWRTAIQQQSQALQSEMGRVVAAEGRRAAMPARPSTRRWMKPYPGKL